MKTRTLYLLAFLAVGALVTAMFIVVGWAGVRQPPDGTIVRSLLDEPAAVEIPPEKSLADLSSAEADFRG